MYYLATDKITVFNYGPIEAEQVVLTGQPFLFTYQTENELREVLQSYGQIYDPLINLPI